MKFQASQQEKPKNKNPFSFPFLLLAAICTLSLCSFFSITFMMYSRRSQQSYCQEQVQRLVDDFESQMDIFEDVALQISINNKYRPFFFGRNAYNEVLLLEDFTRFRPYSTITDDFFLYYGTEKIFLSSQCTFRLPMYLAHFTSEQYDAFSELLAANTKERTLYTTDEEFYLIYPFKGVSSTDEVVPKLCYRVTAEDLSKRFSVISGEINGSLEILVGDSIVFRTEGNTTNKKGFYASTKDGIFSFCYFPDNVWGNTYNLLPVQIALILVNIAMLFFAAMVMAKETYKPIRSLAQQSRMRYGGSPQQQYENALDEIAVLMDSVIRENESMNIQTIQKQKLLHRQTLRVLLSDNYGFDRMPPLDALKIEMPGPLYFVVNISFPQDTEVEENYLTDMQERAEDFTDKSSKEYIYGICNYSQKQVILICSIDKEDSARQMIDKIQNLAQNSKYPAVVGIGNIHHSLSHISASWLESTDSISTQLSQREDNLDERNISDEMSPIMHALVKGNEEEALQSFSLLMEKYESDHISMLMQQYLFIDFTSEIIRLAKKIGVELSSSGTSLLASARNVKSFRAAGAELIQEFCEKNESLRLRKIVDEEYRIYSYVTNNFSNNNLSIESVADAMDTSIDSVRQAIQNQSGMNYRDYVIQLRINFAKTLLSTEDFSINEVCQKVGYLNVSYFIQLFKRKTGMTPMKYKAGGKNEQNL